MNTSALQLRIEEQARIRLLEFLKLAADNQAILESTIANPKLYNATLSVKEDISYDDIKVYKPGNDLTQRIFDHMLPEYVQSVTEELLHRVASLNDHLLDIIPELTPPPVRSEGREQRREKDFYCYKLYMESSFKECEEQCVICKAKDQAPSYKIKTTGLR